MRSRQEIEETLEFMDNMCRHLFVPGTQDYLEHYVYGAALEWTLECDFEIQKTKIW